jgi:hypothetical protein
MNRISSVYVIIYVSNGVFVHYQYVVGFVESNQFIID